LFSTAALTDGLLGLWLLLAVDAAGRSLLDGDSRWAVGAGLYTGLAWWTKYNGWLPLAIEAAAVVLLFVMAYDRRGRWRSWLACFGITVFVAGVIWSLYLYTLRSQGGYDPIAANHARYFVGVGGWLDSVSRQLANQRVLSSWLGAVGIFVAVSLPALFGERSARQRLRQCGIAATLGLAAGIFSSIVVLSTASLVGLVRLWLSLMGRSASGDAPLVHAEEGPRSNERLLVGFCLMAVWWLGLLLSTPCYTPYSRLQIPFMLAAYLAAPLFATEFRSGPRFVSWLPLLVGPTLLGASIVGALVLPRPRLEFSGDRLSLQTIARAIQEEANPKIPRVVYTFGEPAVFFQLRAAGEPVVAPVQDIPATATSLEGRAIPTFLVTGPHTEQDLGFQEQWTTASSNWTLVRTFEYRPSALVYLDLHDPRQPNRSAHAIRLYKMTKGE
jgi:hypothetical protein